MTTSKHFVLLVGGSGTRLWPFSRSFAPKQFIGFKLETTLIQETASRIQTLSPFSPLSDDKSSKLLAITHFENVHEVERQLAFLNHTNQIILGEPERKNTLPAMAWAVAQISLENPNSLSDTLIAVFPSDHHIEPISHLKSDLDKAYELALEGFVVTLGIKPHVPETGYGYIQAGTPVKAGYHVKKFTEKPSLTKAEAYLKEGNYFWNSGIFIFTAQTFQTELKKHEPEIFYAIQKIIASQNNPEVLKSEYSKLKNISIDYGLIEKMGEQPGRVAMVPASFVWNDLGGWSSVFDILPKDENQNAQQGDIVTLDTHNSLLISKKGTLAAIGLQDMVVAQTDDAVLVCPKDRSQDVKKNCRTLKRKKSSCRGPSSNSKTTLGNIYRFRRRIVL
ncbi:MAG: mannose-1-phosphate guanylyltransferase [Deltaproteobacteria bacterium]|nr:MAG: mannose-1-phosphate guanylyltransferase [Deltaproteobacteria bacterium]